MCTIIHLKIIMETINKDEHQLKTTELNAFDKMNFDAVLSICNKRIAVLLDQIPGSKGTAVYVRLMRLVF